MTAVDQLVEALEAHVAARGAFPVECRVAPAIAAALEREQPAMVSVAPLLRKVFDAEVCGVAVYEDPAIDGIAFK